ncbi:MAG: hypothetical protein Q9197_004279 [Variospora fuerteventurae]
MTILAFTNARICRHGALFPPSPLYFDNVEGMIVVPPPDPTEVETIDLQNRILAPAFLELQTNGCVGVHFTNHHSDEEYVENLEKVLPLLKPRTFNNGAALLGAHCEGPFLNPLKKGAHGPSNQT